VKLSLLFLLISFSLQGQNVISFVFQPTDLGIGLRYDRKINYTDGLYLSGTYGNYKLDNGSAVDNHIKISLGLTVDINEISYLSIAPSYHFYGKQTNFFEPLPEIVKLPYSIDLGCGIKINRYKIGFCMDFFKWESAINLGICF
jgi:hypothetical protein